MENTLSFEGTEKKVEMIFSPTCEPLRRRPHHLWKKISARANASIISRFSSSFCDSYILSESSLFVWDHRLLILTCGVTSLATALKVLLKTFKKEEIELIFYQRKNEFFPYKQKSSFMDDFKNISKKIKGRAYLFGRPDEHHFYLYHSESPAYIPLSPDRTVEILMYDLDDSIKDVFMRAKTAKEIRQRLGLDKIFPNSQVDDYIFTPAGYSLNGLVGKNGYYTIHATVQDPGFYVSFETNIQEKYSVEQIRDKVLALFRPFVFDSIVFSSSDVGDSVKSAPSSYLQSSHSHRRLECGYEVSFASFFKPLNQVQPAFELELQ